MPERDKPEQIALMQRMTEMADTRTELAAERNYMAAERTLSVWVRTALALMAFGIAIDRFALLLHREPGVKAHASVNPYAISAWGGSALIALAVLMALATGMRFLAYVIAYGRKHRVPYRHGPFLAPLFALLVALFGVGLLILQFVIE